MMHFSTMTGIVRPVPLESACTCSIKSLPNIDGAIEGVNILVQAKELQHTQWLDLDDVLVLHWCGFAAGCVYQSSTTCMDSNRAARTP